MKDPNHPGAGRGAIGDMDGEASRSPLPSIALQQVLLPAYGPCPSFTAACAEMRWAPSEGHVPRGFAGAVGELEEVRLVLVTAEPGDPYMGEVYEATPPSVVFTAAASRVYKAFETGTDLYHRNLHYILKGCFPDLPFLEQMRRTWITDAVLCSAASEGGNVRKSVESECRSRYLEAQLRLFPNAMVVALGGKAQKRLKGWPGLLSAYSVAPPGANLKKALPSWDAVIAMFHSKRREHLEASWCIHGFGVDEG